jgi:hypothetical protein
MGVPAVKIGKRRTHAPGNRGGRGTEEKGTGDDDSVAEVEVTPPWRASVSSPPGSQRQPVPSADPNARAGQFSRLVCVLRARFGV